MVLPDALDREIIHRVIYEELCLGRIDPGSRGEFRRIMAGLAAQEAQAVILGCTEISQLIGPEDSPVPLFDTTAIHAQSAAEYALSGKP